MNPENSGSAALAGWGGAVAISRETPSGVGAGLERVLRQVEMVAAIDSAVLIQGETGTGKELVARAIHDLSSQRQAPFVKLNCAAIPGGLLESEFFGHERGAFTGALAETTGRLQAADKGTLFNSTATRTARS